MVVVLTWAGRAIGVTDDADNRFRVALEKFGQVVELTVGRWSQFATTEREQQIAADIERCDRRLFLWLRRLGGGVLPPGLFGNMVPRSA